MKSILPPLIDGPGWAPLWHPLFIEYVGVLTDMAEECGCADTEEVRQLIVTPPPHSPRWRKNRSKVRNIRAKVQALADDCGFVSFSDFAGTAVWETLNLGDDDNG